MRLVVDASTLVAEALRRRGRELLNHPDLDLLVAAAAWSETMHELERRIAQLVTYRHLAETTARQLQEEIRTRLPASVTLVPADVSIKYMEQARRRIPRDPDDAPTIALALALECGIWTGDRDFFGCGVAVWTTETLQLYLEQAQL